MKLHTLFCTSCGEEQSGFLDPRGLPVPCEHCQKQPIDMSTLLVTLNLLEVTLHVCCKCNITSPMVNKFCYHCGESLR